jgi:hypothetical protein
MVRYSAVHEFILLRSTRMHNKLVNRVAKQGGYGTVWLNSQFACDVAVPRVRVTSLMRKHDRVTFTVGCFLLWHPQ